MAKETRNIRVVINATVQVNKKNAEETIENFINDEWQTKLRNIDCPHKDVLVSGVTITEIEHT